ncbi:MAG: hypothetical protein IPM39_03185 [Chloroflexi bacterium]|nr:hypothetical protein [Chloroflexota bacterium]
MTARHTPYFNLLDALKTPGCALCTLGRTAVANFMDSMLYEYVNDTEMQQRLTEAHGFCATHSRLLLTYHNALGITILYNAIFRQLETELPQGQEESASWFDRLAGQMGHDSSPKHLAAHAPCPACQIRDETAERALNVLHAHQQDADLAAAWQTSDGLCLPHLRQALDTLDGPAYAMLLSHQRQIWQTLRVQLSEFIRKNDHRFQHEGFSEESDAWRRAVEFTSGALDVF